MHILATTAASLEEIAAPVDLCQPPAPMAALSFTDSDLSGLAAAWSAERDTLPGLNLVPLRVLRHPMSVDLWLGRTGAQARIILLRLLGGLDWWRYGAEQLAATACARGIALAVLPGEDRDDPNLFRLGTLPEREQAELLAYWRAGGCANLRALLRRMAQHTGTTLPAAPPTPLPLAGVPPSWWAEVFGGHAGEPMPEAEPSPPPHPSWPGVGSLCDPIRPSAHGRCHGRRADGRVEPGHDGGEIPAEAACADDHEIDDAPVVPILFYRSMLLAEDTGPISALAEALSVRGITPAPIYVASLKDPESLAFLRHTLPALNPDAIVITTAFAAGDHGGAVLTAPGVPVLQAITATTPREAWAGSPRGLGAADLAMHVVLPELDGRVLAGLLSFKAPDDTLVIPGFTRQANRAEPDRIAQVADRTAALVRLRRTPPADRRIAVLLPDYPGAGGRTGYAVGLDVPASVLALLDDLAAAGYGIVNPPATPSALIAALAQETSGLTLAEYAAHFATLPESARGGILRAWGRAEDDPAFSNGAFRFRILACGAAIITVAPDRGLSTNRRADWHDSALPPRHALLAFGFWLRHMQDVHAIVHMGAHGALEWLPGKAVALTAACYPETVLGPLPVLYPFLVSNPGEAAQARRRINAVTLGHLPPRLAGAGLHGATAELERLLDELAAADGLDRKRRDRLVRLVLDAAAPGTIPNLPPDAAPENALRHIDAWLCDLKELAIKDGLHVYGRADPLDDPLRAGSAAAERAALLAALDGRHIPPGPGGTPQRGRTDVLPTGRNLFAIDPRGLPTRTAMDLGRLAAEEVLRLHLQEHGEMPRALVLDLWGSATLRTGGEEIALGLALMGCRPTWDGSGARVTGVEVLPPAVMGRPRVDITWRVSGLFRDLFPTQIALLDAATQAVAARDESSDENPLAAGRSGETLGRIFGAAPGAYGAGIEDALATGSWTAREELGRAYLAAASHAYGGADAGPEPAPGAFAARVAAAQAIVHVGDDPARDLLEGSADAAHLGGFAAAAELLGARPALLTLDTTDPARPRARTLAHALARLVHGRVSPRFIAGQLRHGPRGAAELAETVDRLVAFAETTRAVPGTLLDQLHDAYLGNPTVLDFLRRENPAAARAIAARLSDARRRGLWHPRRNGVDAELRQVAS